MAASGGHSDQAVVRSLVTHYEGCLDRYGHGPRAVDWKSAEDAVLRYDVMLDLLRDRGANDTLLDFGCGLCSLLSRMRQRGLDTTHYIGLEASERFAAAARERNPGVEILVADALAPGARLPEVDWTVMNGIFTRRHDVSVADMERYMQRLLTALFARCRRGLAFNVMSKAVDFESGELFHPDPGRLIGFVTSALTRHYVLRNDYGLFETCVYLYRRPVGGNHALPEAPA